MTAETFNGSCARLTRRAFVAGAVSGAALAFAPMPFFGKVPAVAGEPRGAVVTFYMDRLYLDRSGLAQPYHPPAGMRAGAPVEHLSEEEFRRWFVYV